MARISPRHLLGTLAGAAALTGLAIFASLGGGVGSSGGGAGTDIGLGAQPRPSLGPSRAGLTAGLHPGQDSSGRSASTAKGAEGSDAEGSSAPPEALRLFNAPGGRLELDPVLQGLSSSIGLARPGATSAGIDLRQVVGALGLDQLGALSNGLIGVVVDDHGLALAFDPGVVARTWNRFVGTIAQWWTSGVRHAAEAQVHASQWAMTWFDGNRPVSPPQDGEMPSRAILLVHAGAGDGAQWTTVWEDLLPALCDAGQMAVQFEYSRKEPLPVAADGLGEALIALRAHGVVEVDLVAHSDGGLVVRDVLTRPSWYASRADGGPTLPRVGRAILVGTPNHGAVMPGPAPLAATAAQKARAAKRAGEVRTRTLSTGSSLRDGAAIALLASDSEQVSLGALDRRPASQHAECPSLDLRPGSAYLAELNARPLPAGVALTIIAGRSLGGDSDLTRAPSERAEAMQAAAIRDAGGAALAPECSAAAGGWLGDGLVTLDSAMLLGVHDVVVLPGGHRSLLLKRRPGEVPPAIPVILERLSDGWR
jgi:hypothetical protein